MRKYNVMALVAVMLIAAVAGAQSRSGHRGTTTSAAASRGTCVQDWDGTMLYVSSTGGTANGRVLLCSSSQGASAGWNWRVVPVATATAN